MTLKNSIIATILIGFIFIFALLFSLVSGLSIDDLKTPFGKIGHIYFKIYPKLEIKIKNSNLNIPSNTSSSSTNVELKKINKIIQLIPNFISKIEIENLKTENFSINKFYYKNGKIELNSSKLNLYGYLEKNHLNLYFPKYNSNIAIDFKTPLHTHILFKNQSADLKIDFQKNIALIKGEATINNFSEKNITISYANPKIDLKFNLNNYKIKGNLYSKYIGIFIKDYLISLNNNRIEINNYYNLHSNSANIISNNANIFAYNINLAYDKYIFSKIKKVEGYFEDYNFSLNNLLLTYKDLNNTFFKAEKSKISLYHIENRLKSIQYIKFNNFEKLSLKEVNSTSKEFHFALNSKKISGNLNELFSHLIEGNYTTIKTKFFQVDENIAKNRVSSNIAFLDKIKLNNLIVKYSPILEVNFSTNSHFNRSFFQTVNKVYKLEIPFDELKGKNRTFIDVKYDYNNSLNYFAKSYIQKLEANVSNLNLRAKKVKIVANNDKAEINISKGLIKDFNLSFNSNIEYQNNLVKIKNILSYSYYPFIKIENFKLNAIYDLNNSIINLKELKSRVDLNKDLLIMPTIKPLLKYTPIKKVLNDASIQYDFKSQKLTANVNPKYPVFLEKNSSKHKKMNFLINLEPYLKIEAPYVFIEKKKDTFITLYDIDINLSAALKNYEELNDTISKIPSSNSDSKTIIKAVNVNYIYDNFKILSETLNIIVDKETNLTSKYKKSILKAYTKRGYLLAEGKNFSKEELVPSLPFLQRSFEKLNLNFNIIQSPDNILSGNLIINNMIAKDLKTLNNIVAFLNTIPALLSLKSPGYSAKGYKGKGEILFLLYKNIFYLKKIEINGKNLAFKGKGYIDLKNKTIVLKISALMKMKVKNIPVLGKGLSYILFGKDNSITVNIIVKGKLDNPKVSQDLGESILLSPFNIIKRIITLPVYLLKD